MEKRHFLFLSCLFIFGCGSSKLATEDQMKHEFIKEYPGITKAQIFERSQRWIAQNFKSAKQVIDLTDKDAGMIVAKGKIIDIDWGGGFMNDNLMKGSLDFTLTLRYKRF